MNHLSTVLTSSYSNYSTIVVNKVNPIVTIDYSNPSKTVDVLLEACSDIIDARYKPWFAKRFYRLDKDSVIAAAALARADGKNAQKFFTDLVRKVA